MAKKNVEEIKIESRGLRGQIQEVLKTDATHFDEEGYQLMKFHGSYQQDDRDLRSSRKAEGLDKAWQFMVRSKIPGGDLTTEQYLMHDRMADDLGNHTIRLTNRQGIQMHGILMGTLRDCIRRINNSGLTTIGACGDIVRNTVASAVPFYDAPHLEIHELAKLVSRTFYPTTRAYSEIWLDDEKISDEPDPVDPIYGEAFLPRKFKIGIGAPPCNDVDVLTNDVGIIANVVDGQIVGYHVYAGGSFGMSFGQIKTRPALAQPLFYIRKEHIIAALKAIISVQREFGRRDDRKQARLKYLIIDRGMDWFREQVTARLDAPTEPSRPVSIGSTEDFLGWHEHGNGNLFCGIWVPDGRIADTPAYKYRTALRTLCERIGGRLRITSNANIYLCDVPPEQRAWVDEILAANGIPDPTTLTRTRQMSHACVSMPTCGLALAESERVFQELLTRIDAVLIELKLEREPLLIRMSGCPNGCPRPYNADFAFVGRAPGKYAIYIGGSYRGDRLVSLATKMTPFDELTPFVAETLKDFVQNRHPEETFTDYWGRQNPNSANVDPAQFHLDPAAPPVTA